MNTAIGGSTCDKSAKTCKFNIACKDVPIKTEGDFVVEIYDDSFTKSFTIKMQELLFPGTDIGEGADVCYYGVFEGDPSYRFSLILGQVFLKQYYAVFDLSTYDEFS